MKLSRSITLVWLTSALFSSCVTTPNASKVEKPKPYPFDYCAVNRQPFHEEEGPKYGRIYDGYRVKFCCMPCTKAFDINPEAFMGPIRAYYRESPDEKCE